MKTSTPLSTVTITLILLSIGSIKGADGNSQSNQKPKTKVVFARTPKSALTPTMVANYAAVAQQALEATKKTKAATDELYKYETAARNANWELEKERLTKQGKTPEYIAQQKEIVDQYIKNTTVTPVIGISSLTQLLNSETLDKESLFLQYEKVHFANKMVSAWNTTLTAVKDGFIPKAEELRKLETLRALQLPDMQPFVEKAKKELDSLPS